MNGRSLTEGVAPSLATVALESIRGGTEAQRLVSRLRHEISATDTLLLAARETLANGSDAFCQGFFRELQKRMEGPK